jgi:hypothetical protein
MEKWNENVELCKNCGIEWKKKGVQCPVCFHCEKGDIGRQEYILRINKNEKLVNQYLSEGVK